MKVVVKFMTYEGNAFYDRVPDDDLWQVVKGVMNRNGNIASVVIEDMTEEEYHDIPVTSGAVAFFGGS